MLPNAGTNPYKAAAQIRKAKQYAFALAFVNVPPELVEKIGEPYWLKLAEALKTTTPSATTKKLIARELSNYDKKVRTA